MATPYGHTLAGLTLLNLFRPDIVSMEKKGWRLYAWAILAANWPDLDFLPGLLVGDPGRFHHGPWHSLSLAFVISSAAGLLLPGLVKTRSLVRSAAFFFLLIFSHLFLDFFTEDPLPPIGFPALWPFVKTPILSPLSIFPYVLRHPEQRAFWSHNLLSLAVESFLLLPFYVLSFRRRPSPSPTPSDPRDRTQGLSL